MTDFEQPISQPMIDQRTNEAAGGVAAEPGAASLEEQLAQAQAKAAEYLDGWQRAVAELSNARKRMQREQAEFQAAAASRILEKLLPVVDDVDRAFTALPSEQATGKYTVCNGDWINGFRLIQRKLQAFLEGEGVTIIPTAGQTFDPALHYAITHEPADGYAEGQIIAEAGKGYRLGEKVLRPAIVRVAKVT
jgi:molecular chaperone GrpE